MSKHKINNVISLLKVKVGITASGDDGDKDLLPKFLLLREVRLRLERVWNTMLTRSQRGPPYSPHALTNVRCRDSTIGALRAHMKPLQQGRARSPTRRRLPPTPRSFTTTECGSEVTSRSRGIQDSRVTRSNTKWMD